MAFRRKQKSVVKKTKDTKLISPWIWMVIGSIMTVAIGAFLFLWQPFASLENKDAPQDGYREGATDIPAELIENSSKTDADTQLEESTAEEETEKFDFYEILPSQDVTPIPDETVVLEEDTKKKLSGKSDVIIKAKVIEKPKKEAQNNKSVSKKQIESDNVGVEKPLEISQEEPDPIEEMLQKKGINYVLQINSYGSAEEADSRRAEVLFTGVEARVLKTKLADGGYLYQVVSEMYLSKEDVLDAQERLKTSGIDAVLIERKIN